MRTKMNIGSASPTITDVTTTASPGQAGDAAPIDNSSAQNSEQNQNVAVAAREEQQELAGGAPKPLKQMATADFLSLHNTYNSDNVMDKMEKMFDTILALKILEDTIENIKKSFEDNKEGSI